MYGFAPTAFLEVDGVKGSTTTKSIAPDGVTVRDDTKKDSEFRLLDNIWKDCSIGLSYQF